MERKSKSNYYLYRINNMDIDELMDFISSDNGSKRKNKKKKKPNVLAKNNKYAAEALENTLNMTNTNNKISNASVIKHEDFTDKELEEFKHKIMQDSIKLGQIQKIIPKFSAIWIKELTV